MAIEDIKKDLDKRFAEPLPEFYKRRIIFWNDEEGEFKEEIESLALDNAKVLALSETNQFASKKLLNEDDLTSNYLVYTPIVTDNEHDWFLDIKLYSEEYRADLISRWMQEMNILNTTELRSEVIVLFKILFINLDMMTISMLNTISVSTKSSNSNCSKRLLKCKFCSIFSSTSLALSWSSLCNQLNIKP